MATRPGRPLPCVFDDGGRETAGYRGRTGDCVTRAIAIALELPYSYVYNKINERAETERVRPGGRRSSARKGVARPLYEEFLKEVGWVWVPTMTFGTGCRVHLRQGELPAEPRLIVRVSRHVCAVIDGVIHDTHNPTRGGTRCVYGYYRPRQEVPARLPQPDPGEVRALVIDAVTRFRRQERAEDEE